jgi:sugar phosphate isomerase/epimerase
MDKIKIGTLVNRGMDSPAYIEEIRDHGFESYSLTFWQTTEGTDWQKLADEVAKACEPTGAIISSIGVFGNPMETNELDLATLKGWEDAIDNAHLFGTDIVAGFTGRVRGEPIHKSLERYAEIWNPLADRAGEKNIRIAFENCDMGGDWKQGDWNIAHNPMAWELMFETCDQPNLGLEWEPCHQLVSLMDPIPQLRTWTPRIFHVHGKDATIHWDLVKSHGVHSQAPGAKEVEVNGKTIKMNLPAVVEHRTPGFGDTNWSDVITELRRHGFEGSIDIEGWHDPIYRGDLEMMGQVRALNYLKECRGGTFVPNPA